MKRVVKGFVRLGGILFVAGVIYTGYTVWNVWHASRSDEAQTADAIIVLGAAQYNGKPSPVLKARLDHAAALYKRGLAPNIVVTGGKGDGDRNSEAGASAAYLGTLGVPDEVVLREVQGRSSWESLQASARFMKARGIHKVLLVSDPFHSARIKEMADDLGLDALVSPTRTSPIQGREQLPYYARETGALGFARIFGFSRLAGFEKNFSA